jgi:homoserine kinase type II
MAVLTPLELAEADRLARAHGLGAARRVVPIPAGSVNSNFVVETDSRAVFLRIYEEQGVDGVAYEHALLAHLEAAGVPVPRRIVGPPAGPPTVAGKPVGLFEIAAGAESCQAGVTAERARAVGALLGRVHAAGASFGLRRASRFELARVAGRLRGLERPDLAAAAARLERTIADVALPPGLPVGVIHGDLFRDNVRWEGETIACALDWESASDGVLLYDLAVTLLAWSFGGAMEWPLARAMVDGYSLARPLDELERASLRTALRAACARFATTRITDYELRVGTGVAFVYKDYRRFLQRLDAVEAETPTSLRERLAL